MRIVVAIGVCLALTLAACGAAASSADSVTGDVDRLVEAWNARDGDAVRSMLEPDFTFNSPSGVDVTSEKWAGEIDEVQNLTIERVADAVRNDDGTYTFQIEATNPNSRYPAAYTWQVQVEDGRIVRINERRGTG